ncbi:MAG: hypothetical protein A2V85_17380 [Chloroflexi bacterium RBG_16_72_14]|nr:MAG: hypothetical protein A2V85_17380 [Chloroflexi bacterium RBG_16_72_14]
MRERYNRFIGRHEVAWELSMAGLAIVYLALGFSMDQAGGLGSWVATLEIALTVLFALEFGSRLVAARDRAAYVRGHWIDAVALLPPARGARVLRLLRLLRLVRAFASVYRAGMSIERLTRHRGFAWILTAWFGVMVLSSAGLYIAEHGVNQAIESPFDAVWWGISTMTTVGYGDVYPTTLEGRLAAMTLMVLGIGLFSAVTASITSFLVSSSSPTSIAVEVERLVVLRDAGSLTPDEFERAKARVLA